jgi:hypothetical protein
MTLDDQVRDHLSRCQRQLLALRMLAFGQDSTAESRQTAAIRDVTNAIITEAEAMSRAALEPRGSGQRVSAQQGSEVFIWVRVARLAMAADGAVSAARCGDAAALRDQLRHFDTLASALWTVDDAVSGRTS